ncbi:MAG: phosphohistidine phosphatase SixA [Oligoflexia bacterium]|nr:phosphohistidine phosphatase SixA [Oligoflexia bacterium]
MKIYFIRHGIAEDSLLAQESGRDDRARHLTDEGVEKANKIARFLYSLDSDLEKIYSSEYVRAEETARIFAKEYDFQEIEILTGMGPFDGPKRIIELVRDCQYQKIAIFGHEPSMSKSISTLLNCTGQSIHKLKKCGIVCVEKKGQEYFLQFILTPKIILKLEAP